MMTLRGQLVISNMAMLLLPIVMAVLVNVMLLSYLQEPTVLTVPDLVHDMSPASKERRARPMREVFQKAQTVYRQINSFSIQSPDSLLDPRVQGRLSRELEVYFGGLVIRKGESILFQSPHFEGILPQDLPRFGDVWMNNGPPRGRDKNYRLLAQEDFKFSDGSPGSAYIIWNLQPWDSEFSTFNALLILTFSFFSLVVNFLLTWLFSRRLMKPVVKLREAFSTIEAGDYSTQVFYQTRDETLPLFQAFEGMRKKLQENKDIHDRYEANRREMIVRIAHDLRTPITAINGYVQGILDGIADSDEKREKYLTVIAAKARDLSQMADELFLFSSLDVKAVPYDFHPLDLNTFLRDLWDEVLLDYADQGMVGSAPVLSVAPVWVTADAGKIRKIIVNLAENAVKYKKTGSPVTWEWRLTREGAWAVFRAHDDGKGISAEALPHIFERFYREDSARSSSTTGTGLGLAIVKHIAEDHGGSIEALSIPGQGTELVLRLPLCPPPEEKKP